MGFRSHLLDVKVPGVTDLIAAVEQCYDAIPRVGGARVERVGPFELFLRDGVGWSYYARPRLGATTASQADVDAVRARQRELAAPEALEWVHDLIPSLLPAVQASGLSVVQAPLMVLDADRLPPTDTLTDATVDLLDPISPDFPNMWAQSRAVAAIGFGAGGTAVGDDGPAERDAALAATEPDMLDFVIRALARPQRAEAVAHTAAEGVLARGGTQGAGDAVEIVGVATLPSARHRGLGAAVSASLARHALDTGHGLVFLGAASEDVARVYARIGFRRIGTACIAEPAPSH
jgi:GNAT superfamily N-acetyltransferase